MYRPWSGPELASETNLALANLVVAHPVKTGAQPKIDAALHLGSHASNLHASQMYEKQNSAATDLALVHGRRGSKRFATSAAAYRATVIQANVWTVMPRPP